MGQFNNTCHVVTCLKGEPLGKSDIGQLWAVWHGNDSTHGHQVGAADEHMSPLLAPVVTWRTCYYTCHGSRSNFVVQYTHIE